MAPSRSAVFCLHSSFFSLDECCPTERWESLSSVSKDGGMVSISPSLSSGSGGKSTVVGGGAIGGGGGGISSSDEF
jgi:hypothetical protein